MVDSGRMGLVWTNCISALAPRYHVLQAQVALLRAADFITLLATNATAKHLDQYTTVPLHANAPVVCAKSLQPLPAALEQKTQHLCLSCTVSPPRPRSGQAAMWRKVVLAALILLVARGQETTFMPDESENESAEAELGTLSMGIYVAPGAEVRPAMAEQSMAYCVSPSRSCSAS